MKTGEIGVDMDIQNLITSIRMDPKINQNNNQLQICLSFAEEESQKYFGFFKTRKPKTFEKWILPIKLTMMQQFNNLDATKQMEDKLTEIILKITEIVNANYDHFDENFDSTSTKPLKYPYEVIQSILILVTLPPSQTNRMRDVKKKNNIVTYFSIYIHKNS